ncbi:hypothetical protein KIN20_026203 [Parelaphostrongylus tenuis]|uniref:Uncharacterized protein n=1 Tax=Parelaphostrongylus tenuis TaxID=148309 RepID=A0AAD5QXW1_PARTN|nr:hypothetical protein KIN20_026203 [Parelaphostrongylus tenuis]
MLKLGVVEPAVRLKMQSEGVDPSLLDHPDAPSPNIANTVANCETSLSSNLGELQDQSESSSVSSFSDSD